MYDLPHFIDKALDIYGYPHFVNDVGGSLCELDEPGVLDLLVEKTLILYIQVTNKQQEQRLIERAVSDPKPLYYRPEFLQEHLRMYFDETGLEYASQIDPDDFARWVFPHLFHSRLPRYDGLTNYDARCSGEFFGLLSRCETSQKKTLVGFFEERGATVRIFEPET